MTSPRTRSRRFTVAAAALALGAATLSGTAATATTGAANAAGEAAVPAGVPAASPAAKTVVAPGRFTGLGFDTCTAPDQATMDELRAESPYWGVGVYIGGQERGCPQPELDRGWVRTQAAKGWRLFPVWVGRQSRCADRAGSFDAFISARNKVAGRQGVAAANDAVRTARSLGFAKGSTLFLDVEGFDNTSSACNQPVLHFQEGWNNRLRALGFKGGFYSAGSSGIALLQLLHDTGQEDAYRLPSAIWISAADGRPSTSVRRFVDDGLWRHQRLHQYEIDVTRTFGDVTLSLDSNAIDVGGGARPPAAAHDCGGVTLDFAGYPRLQRGDHKPQVKAAQCLLKQRGLFKPGLSDAYTAATVRGVKGFQRKHGLFPSGKLDASTWTALLSAGPTPLSKRGSVSDRVRAVQRAVTAALGKQVPATGVFTPATTTAVSRYQRRVGLDPNGIVGRDTWRSLQDGSIR